jgi:polyketide synthase PksJ
MASDTAALLTSRGITSGKFVGVIYHSSIEMISAILGVLKAGAAFIPIDSSIPHSRIDFILETSNCEVALVSSSFDISSLKYDGVECLDLIQALAAENHQYVDTPVIMKTEDPAYAIFTRYVA